MTEEKVHITCQRCNKVWQINRSILDAATLPNILHRLDVSVKEGSITGNLALEVVFSVDLCAQCFLTLAKKTLEDVLVKGVEINPDDAYTDYLIGEPEDGF